VEEKFLSGFSEKEITFFTMMFNVTGAWADLWLQVKLGTMAKEEAFDEFDRDLRGLGTIIATLIQAHPELVEDMATLQRDPESAANNLFSEL
jgi:hypothetical protein